MNTTSISIEFAALNKEIKSQLQQKNYVEAENLAQAMLANIQKATIQATIVASDILLYDIYEAITLNHLGLSYYHRQYFEQAERMFKKALDIFFIKLKLNQFNTKEYADANAYNALNDDEKMKYNECIAVINNCSMVLYMQNNLHEAEMILKHSIDICNHKIGKPSLDIAQSINNLGLIYIEQQNLEAAEKVIRQALSIRQNLNADQAVIAESLNNLAGIYYQQQKYHLAEPIMQQVFEADKSQFGLNNVDTSLSMHNLAIVYLKQGKKELAKIFFKKAVDVRKDILGYQHPDTVDSLNYLNYLNKL
jgi:tetratricopeptide (TPR) repeat protein